MKYKYETKGMSNNSPVQILEVSGPKIHAQHIGVLPIDGLKFMKLLELAYKAGQEDAELDEARRLENRRINSL